MSKEELQKLKDDIFEIKEKLRTLTDEELDQVFGGESLGNELYPDEINCSITTNHSYLNHLYHISVNVSDLPFDITLNDLL